MESVENDNYRGTQQASNDEADGAAEEKLMASGDSTKIKFTSGNSHASDGKLDQNGDAKVDIENVQAFVGLSKEELMKYANDPFWVRLRMLLFVLFWLLWVAMLVGAVIIIVVTPRCPPPPKLAWWQSSPAYQVRVDAFRDSDADGAGDFRGLLSKLNYIKDLGMNTLVLSSIFPSSGNGPTDFKSVDPKLGSLEDFDVLLNTSLADGLHVVLELDPTYTGKEHAWFQASLRSEEAYDDFYIWRDGSRDTPPNNWMSPSGGSAWTYDDGRGQYYLHAANANQPKLNFHSPAVREQFVEILEFWMDRGVSGFKVNGAPYLTVAQDFDNEVPSGSNSSNLYDSLVHNKTRDQPHTFHVLGEWRERLSNYTATQGTDYKVLITDDAAQDFSASALYYGSDESPVADLVLNRRVRTLEKGSLTARAFLAYANDTLNATPKDLWPGFLLGSQDVPRLVERIGEENLDAVHMFALLAHGTPVVFYGDELGTRNSERDGGASVAMQWTDEVPPAEFSASRGSAYSTANVQSQEHNDTSHLRVVQRVSKLREKPVVRLGDTVLATLEEVFVMLRVRKGTPGYLLAVNFGEEEATVNLADASDHVPESGHVEVVGSGSQRQLEVKVKLADFHLDPHEAVVLQIVPIFKKD